MAHRLFTANYRRFTAPATNLIARIASARGTIEAAPILPPAADQLRASAVAGTVHYSNLIEGNELPLIEAERAARGALKPESVAKIELINYVRAIDLIAERVESGTLHVDLELVLALHGALTEGLGRPDDPHFKPHHEGAWRDGAALVVDRLTNTIMHEGVSPEDVPEAMAAMMHWLSDRLEGHEEPPAVLASVAHFAVTDIHPFADGNGRVARLLQMAVVAAAGELPGLFFTFERQYAKDRAAYYAALRSVRRNTFNMEHWLEYNLSVLAAEYERVASRVLELSTFMPGGSAKLRLTPSQERALTTLRGEGRHQFGRVDYERAAGIGRTTALRDIAELRRHGIVTQSGTGPQTKYHLGSTQPSSMPRGRKLSWTDERIEREMRAFVAGRTEWPSYGEFRTAGKLNLYQAASRAGGVSRWRRRLGL